MPLYPGRCPGLRASAPSGRAAYMGCCPFRACCLYGLLPFQGVLLIWASAPSGRAAYMGFCPFRACSLYGLLPFQGVLLIWASALSGRAAYMGFWPFQGVLLIWAFGPSRRCCPMQISQNFPSCTVEITQHALLYGCIYPARPERAEAPSPGQRPGY